MIKQRLEALVSGLVLALSGCAFDLAHVPQTPVQLEGAPDRASFELADDVTINAGVGYKRTLKRGTRWRPVGRITQGDIYRTNDQVLTVEASNIHEAYIVVSSGKLVGFYLPVEKSFSSSTQIRDLPIKELATP